MPNFSEHIHQVERNLVFLVNINSSVNDCKDWQVTVCFYSALHLINAHLSKFSLQYRSHVDVKDALNPYNPLAIAKLPETEYVSYTALQALSRRSRYLINVNNIDAANALLIYDPHLRKAIRHLDVLLSFFENKYGLNYPDISLKCLEIPITNNNLQVIKIIN